MIVVSLSIRISCLRNYLISYDPKDINLDTFVTNDDLLKIKSLFKDKNNIIQTEIEINLDNNKTASLILKKNKDIFSNRILAYTD
jgi:hypothetical protein